MTQMIMINMDFIRDYPLNPRYLHSINIDNYEFCTSVNN